MIKMKGYIQKRAGRDSPGNIGNGYKYDNLNGSRHFVKYSNKA